MTTLDTAATHVANSTPYAWPFNGDLTPAATAALVVESAGGGPVAAGSSSGRAAVVEVVTAVRRAGGAVIRVVTSPPARSAPGGGALELPIAADIDISAAGIDGFYGSSLDAYLRAHGIQRLILVGSGLETCVHSTLRSANDRGFECLLVIDACIAFDDALIEPSVSMIEMSGGIFGAVGFSADVVAAFAPAGGTS